MSLKDGNPRDPRADERAEGQAFLARRVRAFADRSRQPGDAVTWAVVLGSMVGVLMLICFSVAGDTRYILYPLALFIAWYAVVSIKGRVNITSILWGSAATDSKIPADPFWVHQPTIILTIAGAIACIADAVTGWDYRWFGLALAIACVSYVMLYVRSVLQPTP